MKRMLLHSISLLSDVDGGVLDCRINLRGVIKSVSHLRPGDSAALLAVNDSFELSRSAFC